MSTDNKNRFETDEDAQAESAEGQNEQGGEFGFLNSDDSRFQEDSDNLIDFLKFPSTKRQLAEFIETSYKSYEGENVYRGIERLRNEHKSEQQGSTPYYKPGHIGPLLYEYLNMLGVESSFVSGLQHTKSSLTKTVQQRVDEINTLLRGVGGFNRQIKPSFTRNSVVYLEQEDPRNIHRERVIFTINLADFELRHTLGEHAAKDMVEDGRTVRRWVWDEAINNLSMIVSNTGLKPKYIKNDKESCRFTMRQYLLSSNKKAPDEYFMFDLRYMNEETRLTMEQEYANAIAKYEKQIEKFQNKIYSRLTKADNRLVLREKLAVVQKDRDFFVATNPNPKQMDPGLVFSIFSNTMKDYGLTKDKMQVIMTKFILSLSTISEDKSMDATINSMGIQNRSAQDRYNKRA